jgi:hypothetical protein
VGIDALFRPIESTAVATLTADEDRLYDYAFDRCSEAHAEQLFLARKWDKLHFVLTGTPDPDDGPLSLKLGGTGAITPGLGGYVFSADRMRKFNDVLASVSDDELSLRFDAKAMAKAGVYKTTDDDRWEDLAPAIVQLRQFVRHCADKNLSAFLFLL